MEAGVLLRAMEAAPKTAGLTAIDAAEVVARPKPNLANISSIFLIYYLFTENMSSSSSLVMLLCLLFFCFSCSLTLCYTEIVNKMVQRREGV